MTGIIAMRRGEALRVARGRFFGDLLLASLVRGPGYVEAIARDFPECGSAIGDVIAAVSIDFDRRRAEWFDQGVSFDLDDARVNGWRLGTAARVAGYRSLDLRPEEHALERVLDQGVTPERFRDGLSELPSWHGWTLAWITPQDFERQFFPARPPAPPSRSLREVLARALALAPGEARQTELYMRLSIDGTSFVIDCRDIPTLREAGDTEAVPFSIAVSAADAMEIASAPHGVMRVQMSGRLALRGDPMLLAKVGRLVALGLR